MAKLTISEASKKWNVGRSTLYRMIQSGKLSATTGKGGRKLDTSELLRVLGEPEVVSRDAPQDSQWNTERHVLQQLIEQLKTENEFLREQVAELTADLREIRRPLLPRLLPWMKE